MGSRYYPRERNQRERLAETAPRAEPMNRRTEKAKGDWKIRRYWTAALIREIAFWVSVGLVSLTAFPFLIAKSRQSSKSMLIPCGTEIHSLNSRTLDTADT